MTREVADSSPIESLARLLGGLRRSFGAEIIDVRDDLDGGIVVDVKVNAGQVLLTGRRMVRERVSLTLDRSHELVDRTRQLQRRNEELTRQMAIICEANRAGMRDSRARMQDVRRLRLEAAAPAAGGAR